MLKERPFFAVETAEQESASIEGSFFKPALDAVHPQGNAVSSVPTFTAKSSFWMVSFYPRFEYYSVLRLESRLY